MKKYTDPRDDNKEIIMLGKTGTLGALSRTSSTNHLHGKLETDNVK
jgi:hypothetical protein